MSNEETAKTKTSRLKQIWQKYEAKIIVSASFILVAVIAFEAGALKGQKWQNEPLIVEKPAILAENNGLSENTQNSPNNAPEAQNLPQESQASIAGQIIPDQNCAFVGSKNSNKYHLPTCRFAKNIKPENLVCFSSIEDAIAKGYQPDKTCIK